MISLSQPQVWLGDWPDLLRVEALSDLCPGLGSWHRFRADCWDYSLCNLAVQIIAEAVLFSFLWFKIPSRLSRLKEIFKSLDKIFVTQHFIVLKSQGVAGGRERGAKICETSQKCQRSDMAHSKDTMLCSTRVAGSGQYIIIWVSVAPWSGVIHTTDWR